MLREFKLLRGYKEKRIYHINVGHINDTDIQYFIDRLRSSLMVPARYLTHEEIQIT